MAVGTPSVERNTIRQNNGGIKRYLPFLDWLVHYRRADLSGDVMAGMIVAIMLVPQGMAYALLAGLPPEIGLYASIVPVLIYAVFGTSRQLAVGPVAIVSLLTASALAPLFEQGTAGYISAAAAEPLLLALVRSLVYATREDLIPEFRAYAPDKRLCVAHYINQYLLRTAPLRSDYLLLILSYAKPHKPISRNTLSRYIRTTMTMAGIDPTFTPHSTRAAATSKAQQSGVPLNEILNTAGWSTAQTFAT